jgi:DNA-binding CsgD family transcriptional regulator
LEVFVPAANSSAIRVGKVAGPRRRKTGPAEQSAAPDRSLRKTGIRVMGDMPWGAHICIFYETKKDLLDTATAYFAAGLKSNDFCLWLISDPITEADAKDALGLAVPDLDRHLAAGQIEIRQTTEWFLRGDRFDLKRALQGWNEKLQDALARGYEGMRLGGTPFWPGTVHWIAGQQLEVDLDRWLAGKKMIVLCTYSLHKSSAVDVLDVARAHQCTTAKRNGDWEVLKTPELRQAKQEISKLTRALDILSRPFPGHASLTPRERTALAQIVKGASSKEAARALGISPRTVEFHRANVMQKLGAKNTADLVRRVVGE